MSPRVFNTLGRAETFALGETANRYTPELESFDNIRAASFIAMRVIREGDFIKTSPDKPTSAELDAIRKAVAAYQAVFWLCWPTTAPT